MTGTSAFESMSADGRHLPPQLSNDFRIAITPAETFALLVAEGRRGSWLAALSRPAFVAVVLGCATSISTTGVVSAISILSGTICWSFAPALQVLTGLWLCRRPPSPRVDRARASELSSMAHAPWTIWIILASASVILLPLSSGSFAILVVTALVPAIWTRRLMTSFGIHVLGCERRDALRRARFHQFVTWAIVVAYVGFAIGIAGRASGWVS